MFVTGATLSYVTGASTSFTLLATDADAGSDVDYSVVSGTLPTGLSLDGETGVVSGTPTTSQQTVTFRATDQGGNYVDKAIKFNAAPVWSTAAGALTNATKDSAYSTTLVATDDTGSTPAYSIVSGSLPTGLSLNTSSGVISGTPTVGSNGTASSFTVRATDADGATADRAFTLYVTSPQIVSFTSSTTWTAPLSTNVEVLVVAGGGGGGGAQYAIAGGGGGAGGYRYNSSFAVTSGTTYTVTVGSGGGAGYSGYSRGGQGGTSGFGSYQATGGGGGGAGSTTGGSGGSGGGGGGSGGASFPGSVAGSGNAGGYSPVEGYAGGNGQTDNTQAGGGGGSAGTGQTGPSGGNGGSGTVSSISGSSVTYAQGGNGSANGADKTTAGSGGLGAPYGTAGGTAGKTGIVILKYMG